MKGVKMDYILTDETLSGTGCNRVVRRREGMLCCVHRKRAVSPYLTYQWRLKCYSDTVCWVSCLYSDVMFPPIINVQCDTKFHCEGIRDTKNIIA
jgi:hypothetical protein